MSSTFDFRVGDRVLVSARDEGQLEGEIIEDRPQQEGCIVLTDGGRKGGFGYSEMLLLYRPEAPTAWNRLGKESFNDFSGNP